MIEHIKHDPILGEVDLPEIPYPFVLVNKFSTESYKEFMKDCTKVMSAGFDFLPIVIDSYGGEVYSLLAMCDYLRNCDKKIITVCEGKAMSCGAILMSMGDERYIGNNATVMVHSVSSMEWGKESEIAHGAKEVTRLNNLIYRMLDDNTEQEKGFWRDKIREIENAELYLSAKKAKEYGMATDIGIPKIHTEVKLTRTLVK